jgi:hypothetical protein
MTGLILGIICIIGGVLLFLNGVTGSSSWTAKILGNESNLTDAAPGAILFIVGLFVIIATRYSPQVDYETERETENVNPEKGKEKGRGTTKTREIVKVKAKAKAKKK